MRIRSIVCGKKKVHSKSISREIILVLSGLVAGAIFLCLLLNFTVLERYYTYEKEKTLKATYQELSEAASSGDLYKETYINSTFVSMAQNKNLGILVVDSSNSVVLYSGNNKEMASRSFLDYLYGNKTEDKPSRVLEENDDYSLTLDKDQHMNEGYLSLCGTLSDGNMVLIRAPLESIRESVGISNRFLLAVGLISIVAAILIGIAVTRKITGPVLVLTDISKRMVDLNFETKYTPDAWKNKEWRRKRMSLNPVRRIRARREQTKDADAVSGNEIDQLGEYMNKLSEKLEQTISELKTANLELQSDIEQRTEIDKNRREFLSNVSHELKTPLALIQGYAEGLHECVNDDAESRNFYCDVIVDEAGKMNTLVQKLLVLNEMESGSVQTDMERFNITELIRGVADSMQILQEGSDITLSLDIPEDEYVWGDEFKIEEVITNYLSNAIHHCEGEKKIRVFYEKRPDDLLRISVFNTGTPIPEEDLPHLWEKFYKVDKAHTREYGGSGIGLSIVHVIMDQMHQACGVINHEDGVEFWLELSQK